MEQESQHGCLSSTSNQNAVDVTAHTPDSDMVVQGICYLGQVLDAATESPSNGNTSPSEHMKPISIDGTSPSVCVLTPLPDSKQSIVVEGQRQTTFLHQINSAARTNGHVKADESGSRRAKFELRAFQEERRPAKLFSAGEEQQVRVTRRRPSEEVQELERERQELIREQAVKKNPGIAQRWWNPPQEVPLEEQLDGEQLESLRKYQERKQQMQNNRYIYTQASGSPTAVTFDPDMTRKEDIVEEQIDFSSARQQFLQEGGTKKDVASHLYSTKPFSRSKASQVNTDIVAETGETHVTWFEEGIAGEFMCAQAVMTIVPEEEEATGHFHSAILPEESDSGMDELSVRSQETTAFSLDNISDSGASLPLTPLPLTPVSTLTPQPTTPVNVQTGVCPTEDELNYHAGVLVQNAIQNVLAGQNRGDWQSSQLNFSQLSPPLSPSSVSTSSPMPISSPPVSSGGGPSFQSPMSRLGPSNPPLLPGDKQVQHQQQSTNTEEHFQTPSPHLPQPISPQQRPKERGPRIKIQSSYSRALASSAPAPAPGPAPVSLASAPRPTPVYRSPSPPSPDKAEFSYFSKYSEAAELRSTAAVTRGPEVEVASGPFRLRSKKQRTLSMIEEEIRAAQQREEELKKQREMHPVIIAQPSNTSSSHGPVRIGMRQKIISPAEKMKCNSLPTGLSLTAHTAPGKIEKVRPVPPVSPSPSEGALSDVGSEDSGGSRHKNFMQTLMEDYETHKVKRREKTEDNSVLEATRVTRRKSDMALKWEAGIYANEDIEGEGGKKDDEEE